MPITRDYTPKDVFFIGDFPLVKEQESGKPYSEYSHTQLKDALIQSSIQAHKNLPNKHHLGVNEVCYTYLSMTRPAKGDNDWAHSVVNKKGIPEGKTYIQCEWLKDVWVSELVYTNIMETINQIKKVQPKLIVCSGKWAFLFLATLYNEPTSQLSTIAGTKTTLKRQIFFGGLNKYRASILTLHSHFNLDPIVLIPVLTPSYHWTIKQKAFIIKSDYNRVGYIYSRLMAGTPTQDILSSKRMTIVGYTKDAVIEYLNNILTELASKPIKITTDVETKFLGIDCIGLCYKPNEAFTIPITELYMEEAQENELAYSYKTINKKRQLVEIGVPAGTPLTKHRHYWNIEDEIEIMHLLQQIMLHPNCRHVGQNLLYDMQMYYREWKLQVYAYADTMIQHHCLFNFMPKDLGTLASMYCSDFVMYKDEIDGLGQGIKV